MVMENKDQPEELLEYPVYGNYGYHPTFYGETGPRAHPSFKYVDPRLARSRDRKSTLRKVVKGAAIATAGLSLIGAGAAVASRSPTISKTVNSALDKTGAKAKETINNLRAKGRGETGQPVGNAANTTVNNSKLQGPPSADDYVAKTSGARVVGKKKKEPEEKKTELNNPFQAFDKFGDDSEVSSTTGKKVLSTFTNATGAVKNADFKLDPGYKGGGRRKSVRSSDRTVGRASYSANHPSLRAAPGDRAGGAEKPNRFNSKVNSRPKLSARSGSDGSGGRGGNAPVANMSRSSGISVKSGHVPGEREKLLHSYKGDKARVDRIVARKERMRRRGTLNNNLNEPGANLTENINLYLDNLHESRLEEFHDIMGGYHMAPDGRDLSDLSYDEYGDYDFERPKKSKVGKFLKTAGLLGLTAVGVHQAYKHNIGGTKTATDATVGAVKSILDNFRTRANGPAPKAKAPYVSPMKQKQQTVSPTTRGFRPKASSVSRGNVPKATAPSVSIQSLNADAREQLLGRMASARDEIRQRGALWSTLGIQNVSVSMNATLNKILTQKRFNGDAAKLLAALQSNPSLVDQIKGRILR